MSKVEGASTRSFCQGKVKIFSCKGNVPKLIQTQVLELRLLLEMIRARTEGSADEQNPLSTVLKMKQPLMATHGWINLRLLRAVLLQLLCLYQGSLPSRTLRRNNQRIVPQKDQYPHRDRDRMLVLLDPGKVKKMKES